MNVHESCSELAENGFRGTLDDEPLELTPALEGGTPGTVSVARHACGGGPLTYAFTFTFEGDRARDTLTLHANATADCLIQATYLTSEGDAVPMSVDLTLDVWEDGFQPAVVQGALVVSSTGSELGPASFEGSFTLVTPIVGCVG